MPTLRRCPIDDVRFRITPTRTSTCPGGGASFRCAVAACCRLAARTQHQARARRRRRRVEKTKRQDEYGLLIFLPTYLPLLQLQQGREVPGTTAAAVRVRLSAGVQRRNGALARFNTRGAGSENEGEADRPRRKIILRPCLVYILKNFHKKMNTCMKY